MDGDRRNNSEKTREKVLLGRGMNFFFFTWLACASLHPVQATLSVFPLSFLCLSSLSQCEGVCGCGGLASGWWMPVGVFMVYFWPQQQKGCWCSKSVAPIVSITLLLNRPGPWHTGKRCPALPVLPSWPWSYSGHTHWLPAKRVQSHSALLAPPSYLALRSSSLLSVSLPFSSSTMQKFPLNFLLVMSIKKTTTHLLFWILQPLALCTLITFNFKSVNHIRISPCSTVTTVLNLKHKFPIKSTHSNASFHRKKF